MSRFAYPLNPFDPDLPLCIFGIGREDDQPPVIRKNGFPFPQLFFCLSGKGTLEVNEKSFPVKEGSFFYLLPDTTHAYYGDTQPWKITWIAFSGSIALPLLTQMPDGQSPIDISPYINKIESMSQGIFAALKSDDLPGKAAASGILYEMLMELYAISHRQKEPVRAESKLLKSIEIYIEKNYSEDLTINELAAHAHISPQYLCRLFKKYKRLRPYEYIAMKRIQHAKTLLSDPSLSIAEIARRTGYHDCSYFSLVFRKQELLSPSEFRGMLAKPEGN